MGGTPSPSLTGALKPISVDAVSTSGRDRIDARYAPSREFLGYIDQFRAVAIVFIVAGHSFFLMDWDQQALLPRAVTAAVANGTLMFLFIAGFLFKHLMGQYDTRKYYFTKLRNVILPYVLVSIPAIIKLLTSSHEHRFIPSDFFDWSIWWQVPWLYATGAHLGPFWFIPMIAVIYLIAPLLAWLDRDGRIYYALPVLYVASLFIHRPENNLGVSHAFLFNLPIYLLGMWTAGNMDRVLAFVACFRVPMILAWAALVALGTFVLVDPDNTFAPRLFALPDDVISWITIQKTILTFLLLYYLHKHQHLIGSRLRPIAAASFGIFFVHFYIQTAIWILKGKLDFSLSGGLIGYLAVTAFLFVSSFVVVAVTKAIFGSRSRMLIGS